MTEACEWPLIDAVLRLCVDLAKMVHRLGAANKCTLRRRQFRIATWTVRAPTRVLAEAAIAFTAGKMIQHVSPCHNVGGMGPENTASKFHTLHTVEIVPSTKIDIAACHQGKCFKLGLGLRVVCQCRRDFRIRCSPAMEVGPRSPTNARKLVWVRDLDGTSLEAISAFCAAVFEIAADFNNDGLIILVDVIVQMGSAFEGTAFNKYGLIVLVEDIVQMGVTFEGTVGTACGKERRWRACVTNMGTKKWTQVTGRVGGGGLPRDAGPTILSAAPCWSAAEGSQRMYSNAQAHETPE